MSMIAPSFRSVFVSILFVFTLLGAASSVYAFESPPVFVNSVTLSDGAQYSQGETISGTAVLENQGNGRVAEVFYIVRIVGAYGDDGLPLIAFTEDRFGPISLNAGESKEVVFSITPPVSVAGDGLGVEVEAIMPSGIALGWKSTRIQIAGTIGFIEPQVGYVVINEEDLFDLEQGPTVEKGGSVHLALGYTNETGTNFTLTPEIRISRFGEGGENPIIFSGDMFTLPSGEVVDVITELPIFDTPGVYEGTITIFDDVGVQRSRPLDFRYIVAGTTATIHSLTTGATRVGENTPLAVTVLFTGVPFDVTVPENYERSLDGTLLVRLFDRQGNPLASGSQTIDLYSDTEATISLVPIGSAGAATVEAVILDGNTELAKKSITLESDAAALPVWFWYAVGASGVLGVLVLWFFFFRTGKQTPPPAAVAALLIVGVGATVAGTIYFSTEPETVTAAVISERLVVTQAPWPEYSNRFPGISKGNAAVDRNFRLFFNGPGTTVEPGEEFYVQGSLGWLYCNNSSFHFSVRAGFNGKEQEVTRAASRTTCLNQTLEQYLASQNLSNVLRTQGREKYERQLAIATSNYNRRQASCVDTLSHISGGGGHAMYNFSKRFSLGPFTAPSTPGEHRITIGAGTVQRGAGNYAPSLFGYLPITVEGEPPNDPSISGPTSGRVNISYLFEFTATDPDSDNVLYEIDWDNDETVDVTTEQTSSGSSLSRSFTWITDGVKTFQARAQDAGGARSDWTPHTITIDPAASCEDGIDNDGDGHIDYPADTGCSSLTDTDETDPAQCQDGIDNNGNGLIDYPDDPACSSAGDFDEEVLPDASLSLAANPPFARPTDTVSLIWTAENTQSCSLTGTNGDSWNLSGESGSQTSSPLLVETVYTLACTDLSDNSVQTSVTVKLLPSFEEI